MEDWSSIRRLLRSLGDEPQGSRVCHGVLVCGPSGVAAQQSAPASEIAGAHISPTLYFTSAAEELASRNALHGRVAFLVKELANSDVGVSYYWMRKSLVFQDPLYEMNYLYAALVAVALYDRAHSDPGFATKYEALLSHGFYAKPQVLLATMNIRLEDPELVKAASRLFQSKTDELERMYQAEAAQAK